MKFKGIPSTQELNAKVSQLIIKDEDASFVCHKYEYENGLLVRQENFINWQVTERILDHKNIVKESIFSFEDTPDQKELASIAKNKFEENLLVNSLYYEANDKETPVYELDNVYEAGKLIQQNYKYSDFTYEIKYNYSQDNKQLLRTNNQNEEKQEYLFNDNHELIEYRMFKDGMCKKHLYQYSNGRLDKLIEKPWLEFSVDKNTNILNFAENREFIHESNYNYSDHLLLASIDKMDTLSNVKIEKMLYEYKYVNA